MGLFEDLAKDKALSFGLLNSGLSILANNRGANKGMPAILSGLQNGISGYTTMDKFLREKRAKEQEEARKNALLSRLGGQAQLPNSGMLPPIYKAKNTIAKANSAMPEQMANQSEIGSNFVPQEVTQEPIQNSNPDPQQMLALAMQYPDLEMSKQLIDSVKASQFYVPKFKADNQIVNLGNGKLGIAKFDDKGNETISELTPAEKTKVLNLGGQTLQTGEYTGNPVGIYQNTASPGELLTDARGRASLAQSDRHHAQNYALNLQKFNAEHGAQGGLPKLTVEQGKSLNFVSRMNAADKVISSMPQLTARDQIAIAASGGNLNNYVSRGLSKEVQKYIPAIKDYIAANKYGDSGAAVTKQEWDIAFDQFIPVAGDTNEKLATKARNRAYAIEAKAAGIPRVNDFMQNINSAVENRLGNTSIQNNNTRQPDQPIKFIVR